MRVIGIDPGTQVCGYGIVDCNGPDLKAVDYGVVRCTAGALPERLGTIYGGLRQVMARHGPEAAAVEGAFYGRNPRTAIKIGEARGMVLVAAAGLEVAEYPPATVKQAVAGTGRATKSQVQQMVRLILELPELPEPLDASDALALAICHCHRARLAGLT